MVPALENPDILFRSRRLHPGRDHGRNRAFRQEEAPISGGSLNHLLDRRSLLELGVLSPFAATLPHWARAADQEPDAKADYILRIGTGLVELAPDHIVSTTLYNDQFPGPLLRLKESRRVVVDIHNDIDTPELVHMRGQIIPSDA